MSLRVLRAGDYVNRDIVWFDIEGPKGLHRIDVSGLEHLRDPQARSPMAIALGKYMEQEHGNEHPEDGPALGDPQAAA